MEDVTELRVVYPYGSRNFTISYEAAVGFCVWFRDMSEGHYLLQLALTEDKCYELVGFCDSVDGEAMGCDSEYVTFEVAARLVKDGMATIMEFETPRT